MPTSSGIIFVPPRDLALERLLHDVRAAAADDEEGTTLELTGSTLVVAPVAGAGLLRVEVDGPGGPQAISLLGLAEAYRDASPALVLAWFYLDGEGALTVWKDGAKALDHELEGPQGPTPHPVLNEVLGALKGGEALRLPLTASPEEVARRQPELAALLAALPPADAQRALDVAQAAAKKDAAPPPDAPGVATEDDASYPKTVSDPAAVQAADRTVKMFLVVAALLLAALGGFFALLASRAPH